LKDFASEYKMQVSNQGKMNNEAFVKSFIEFLRKKLSTYIVKERLYEELKDEINELIDEKDYLFQNQNQGEEGRKIDKTDEDFEKRLKEILDKLSEARDKLNNELANIQNNIPEPKSRLELKIEKLKNNLKLQNNENRFLQQKLKNTEKTTEEMTSKIANEFSNILREYDKLNEEISNVHSSTSEDILSFNNSNIINNSPNSILNNNNNPNSIINDNIYLNNTQSESLLMDMTFWSTSDDDYSIEQNLNLQRKLPKGANSMNIDNDVLLNNNDHDISLKDNYNYNYTKNNNSYHQISNIIPHDIIPHESSKSSNTTGSNNIILLKHMFSKIIKQKNIT